MSQENPKPAKGKNEAPLSEGLQVAAATAGAKPAAPVVDASKLPKRARVRSKFGDMRHLLTDQLVTADERMMDIDAFAAAQIVAGKWEVVND